MSTSGVYQLELTEGSSPSLCGQRALPLLKSKMASLVTDRWRIAEATVGLNSLGGVVVDLSRRFLVSPPGTYLADPIDFIGQSDSFLVEKFDIRARRAGLCSLAASDDGWTLVDHTLDVPHHVSYPFTLKVDDVVLLSLECSALQYSALWVQDGCERSWKQAYRIWDEPLADATITFCDDRWILMAASSSSTSPRLTVLQADHPAGPWRRCRLAVDGGSRLLRPAGRPQMMEGTLFVPLQQLDDGYGAAVGWYHYDGRAGRLSWLSTTSPPPPFRGLHTVAVSSTKSLVDLREFRLRTHRPAWLQRRRASGFTFDPSHPHRV